MMRLTLLTLLIILIYAVGVATGYYIGWPYGSDIFPDVPVGATHDVSIGDLHELEVVKGYPDGYYKPKDYVTREELASYLSRAMEASMWVTLCKVDEVYYEGHYFAHGSDNDAPGMDAPRQFWIQETAGDWARARGYE
jgi:hypothetical protein